MKSLFLIDRGAPDPQFNPPPSWRRVIVCDSSRVARLAAGDTADGCTVWQNFGRHNKGRGLLLIRWRGLDIDYGCAFRPSQLPDGTPTGFHQRGNRATWGLLPGATWWSSAAMPPWLDKLGVIRHGPFGDQNDPVVVHAIESDQVEATAARTGTRPFGFRGVVGWRELAAAPAVTEQFLPGMELAAV